MAEEGDLAAMARLIDAEALEKKLVEQFSDEWGAKNLIVQEAYNYVHDAPTVTGITLRELLETSNSDVRVDVNWYHLNGDEHGWRDIKGYVCDILCDEEMIADVLLDGKVSWFSVRDNELYVMLEDNYALC